MALDVRHMQLPIRPSSAPASGVIPSRVSRAGGWAGGQGGATADTWQFVCWPRGRGTPSDSRTQRYGWAAGRSSASRVPLSSNVTTASHGLYKLEIVVIADSRMLVVYCLLPDKSYSVQFRHLDLVPRSSCSYLRSPLAVGPPLTHLVDSLFSSVHVLPKPNYLIQIYTYANPTPANTRHMGDPR
jgi:hypothetical protein